MLQEAAIDFAAVREELDDITEDVERPTVDDGLANDEDKELLTDKLPYVSRRLLQFLSLKTFFDESSCMSGICRLTLLPKFRLWLGLSNLFSKIPVDNDDDSMLFEVDNKEEFNRDVFNFELSILNLGTSKMRIIFSEKETPYSCLYL